jgi:antitoxin component YwqK of YwqJK toxin-antitoxin module
MHIKLSPTQIAWRVVNQRVNASLAKAQMREATFWHANGTIMANGEFRRNQRHGQWAFWTAASRRLAAGSFFRGKRHGVWREWTDGESSTNFYVDDESIGDPSA